MAGTKRLAAVVFPNHFHHPLVGDVTLDYECVALPSDPDQILCRYTSTLIDTILADVRDGRGRTLVLRGAVGTGKTALLAYAVEAAQGLRVEQITGIESEMRFAYAGPQQLLARYLDEPALPHRGPLDFIDRRKRPWWV